MANIFHRKTVFNEKSTNKDFNKAKTKIGQKRKSTTETNLSFKSRGSTPILYNLIFVHIVVQIK